MEYLTDSVLCKVLFGLAFFVGVLLGYWIMKRDL